MKKQQQFKLFSMATGNYYFKFFYQRFVASTQGWKDDAIGAYLKLLIYQFDNDGLPNDFKFLCGLTSSLNKNKHLIMSKFKLCEDGKLRNEVMNKEFERAKTLSEKNSEVGKSGGRPKNRTVSENKPNGYENKSHTNKPINQYNNTITHRAGPELKEVERVFKNQGGTDDMALSFFNKYEALNWKYKGSDIVDFSFLVGNFVTTWNEIKQKNLSVQSEKKEPVKRYNFSQNGMPGKK